MTSPRAPAFDPIPVGRHLVTDGGPPLFLPDIGTFFNQDVDVAEAMVRALSEMGATTIKGEVLHDPDVCLDDDTHERYLTRDGDVVEERYRALIERKVVPLKQYEHLYSYCREQGLDVVVSVYDFKGADFALDIGAAALKIASSNIVHGPLIAHVARLGKPMIIDTGKSTVEETARAIDWARDAGATELIIEHSPPAPPRPTDEQNLRFMITLGRIFGLPYGLSHHSDADEILFAAAALGAHVIETGVCPDELASDQDVAHAVPLGRVPDVLAGIDRVHRALGSSTRELRRDRERYVSRMGLVAKSDVQAGDPVDLEHVHFSFPVKGIAVEHFELVEGWAFRRGLVAGQVIGWGDVEPLAP